ncbi:MAG: hypothetical protein Q8P30_04600 [Candidatus Uhrbacteria bacterium]|nr:hypothetical protein [Candidatus Uhrbacteria bacterium]
MDNRRNIDLGPLPLEMLPSYMQDAIILAKDVTIYTRDKLNDEKILSLQQHTNDLVEAFRAEEKRVDDVESDAHIKILRLTSEIKSEFFSVRKHRALETLLEIEIEAKAIVMEKKKTVLFAIDQIDTTKLIPDEKKADVKRLMNECISSTNSTDRIKIIDLLKSEFDLDYMFYTVLVHFVNIKDVVNFLRFKKKQVKNLIIDNIDDIENIAEYAKQESINMFPRLKGRLIKKEILIPTESSTEQINLYKEDVFEWIKNPKSKRQLEFVYEFIGPDEQRQFARKHGGSDYGDYVRCKISVSDIAGIERHFSFLINEMIGVASFTRLNDFEPEFRTEDTLKTFAADVNEESKKIIEPNISNQDTKDFFKKYSHVDREFRQFQASFTELSRGQAEALIKLIFGIIEN